MTSETQMLLDIVTPTGVIFSGQVDSCQAPGISGGFQILKGHTELISALKIGLIKLEISSNENRFISIVDGFLEVDNNRIVVLTDAAELSDSIDIDRAKLSKDRALERIENPKSDFDIERAQASLKRALNRIKTANLK